MEAENETEVSGTLATLAAKTGLQVLSDVENPFEEAFGEIAKGSWLARLQLEGSNSNLVKDDLIPKGHYALHTGKAEFTAMGPNVECVPLSFRPKAVDLTDPKKPVTSYNHKSEIYQSIKADADSKDQIRKKGKMYGLEFLLYLPDGPTGKKFCTLHMGSPTARIETSNFRPLMKKPARLGVKKIDNGTYKWEAIQVFPLTREIEFEDAQDVMTKIREFVNPPSDTIQEEKVEASEAQQRG